MKTTCIILVVLFSLGVAGCISTRGNRVDEFEAATQMKVADSLESASAIQEAAAHYVIIAERFPASSFYYTAVRKAAYLNGSPLNPTANDSISLHWFQVYTGLPISREEKETAVMYMSLLKRISQLQEEVNNLAATSKKQSSELSVKTNRVHELETQLKEASDELKKLRDVDVKVYKRGAKK